MKSSIQHAQILENPVCSTRDRSVTRTQLAHNMSLPGNFSISELRYLTNTNFQVYESTACMANIKPPLFSLRGAAHHGTRHPVYRSVWKGHGCAQHFVTNGTVPLVRVGHSIQNPRWTPKLHLKTFISLTLRAIFGPDYYVST